MEFTLHATIRSAQRGVPRLTLDSEAIWLAYEDMPWLRGKLERYSNTCLVLSDDQRLITVARRNTRFSH